MKVFLSHAVGPLDASIPARLRAVAAAYDIEILLPERPQWSSNEVSGDSINKVALSDAVIALATTTANYNDISLLNRELQMAAQLKKPVVTLIEQGVALQAPPNTYIINFNRRDYRFHEQSLFNVLSQMRNQQQQQTTITALGWIAGIALGLVALGALFGDEK